MKIDDYALIADGHTAALVSRNGSIDWLCFPRFDSAACFASLVGEPKNGFWLIGPRDGPGLRRRTYRRNTFILETRLKNTAGSVRMVEYMPPRRAPSHACIVREVIGLTGAVEMQMALVAAFGYGQIHPWIWRSGAGVRILGGGEALLLRSPVPVEISSHGVRATFLVRAGQRLRFLLQCHSSQLAPEKAENPSSAGRRAERWTRNWLRAGTYRGPYREAVARSLLVIRAVTYGPTGGLTAAPTTSLPERFGGTRNWDYRYCWLRDTAFALDALLAAGFGPAAADWRNWLVRAVAGDPQQVQTAYTVEGGRSLPESTLKALRGFQGSRPVRIGNAAAGQFQLDVLGEVVNGLHLTRVDGRMAPCAGPDLWDVQQRLLERIEQCWQWNDQGIWEERGRPRPFTYSKVMAWVAADRAVEAICRLGCVGDQQRWKRLRTAIRRDILAHGFSRRLGSFTQTYGSSVVDASALRLPLVGFLSARDPRMHSTVRRIEAELMRDGIIVRRNSAAGDAEAAFLPCSFWLASNYVLMGQKERGRALFERLLGLSNDLGLFAEEYDSRGQQLAGNFPQALTHIALIQCATLLEKGRSANRP